MFFLIIIYLTFISLGLPDSLLGTTWPLMRLDLNMPIEAAGILSFIISGGTIISSFFSHRLIKKFGTGKVTVISVFLTAFALFGYSFSNEFYHLILLSIPLGIGAGAIDAGLNKYVAENYEAKHMNWLHSFWGVGAIIGPILISLFINSNSGWRLGYLVIAIIQTGLFLTLIPTLKKWHEKENGSNNIDISNDNDHVVNKKVVSIVLLSYFIYMLLESTVILWGATYLIEIKSLTEATAALIISLFFVALTIGRMLSGFLSIKINNNNLIKIGVSIIVIGSFMLVTKNNYLGPIGLITIGLGLAPIYPALLHQTPIYFGKKNAQKMMSYQMAFAYTSSTFMPPIIGFFLAKTTFNNFSYIFIIFGVLFGIATLFYPKTRKKA